MHLAAQWLLYPLLVRQVALSPRGPQRWIPSVGAFSWADSISMGDLFWTLGCCRG